MPTQYISFAPHRTTDPSLDGFESANAAAIAMTREILQSPENADFLDRRRLSLLETAGAITVMSQVADDLGLSNPSWSVHPAPPKKKDRPMSVALPDIGDAWLDD